MMMMKMMIMMIIMIIQMQDCFEKERIPDLFCHYLPLIAVTNINGR